MSGDFMTMRLFHAIDHHRRQDAGWRLVGKRMSRSSRPDRTLDQLNDERDQAAIEVSLAWDAEPTDLVRLAALQRKLQALKVQIDRHRPSPNEDRT
jgi:hypothetical protein